MVAAPTCQSTIIFLPTEEVAFCKILRNDLVCVVAPEFEQVINKPPFFVNFIAREIKIVIHASLHAAKPFGLVLILVDPRYPNPKIFLLKLLLS